jgi:hypothetical protein
MMRFRFREWARKRPLRRHAVVRTVASTAHFNHDAVADDRTANRRASALRTRASCAKCVVGTNNAADDAHSNATSRRNMSASGTAPLGVVSSVCSRATLVTDVEVDSQTRSTVPRQNASASA